MKILNKKTIDMFWQSNKIVMAQMDLVLSQMDSQHAQAVRKKTTMSLMMDDLVWAAIYVAGADEKATLKEAEAINKLFEGQGYHTGWLALKADIKKDKYKTMTVPESFCRYVDVQFEMAKELKRSPEEIADTLSRIETLLYMWTGFLCDILIADNKTTTNEVKVITGYMGECCKYVSKVFGIPFAIPQRVIGLIQKIIRAGTLGY